MVIARPPSSLTFSSLLQSVRSQTLAGKPTVLLFNGRRYVVELVPDSESLMTIRPESSNGGGVLLNQQSFDQIGLGTCALMDTPSFQGTTAIHRATRVRPDNFSGLSSLTREDNQLLERMTKDPSTSFWLRSALASAMSRDPVDALQDAEDLVRLLAERHNRVLSSHTSAPAVLVKDSLGQTLSPAH